MSSNPTCPAGVLERSRLTATRAQAPDPAAAETTVATSTRVVAQGFVEREYGGDMARYAEDRAIGASLSALDRGPYGPAASSLSVRGRSSERGLAGSAREGDDVAYVAHAGGIDDGSFQAQAEAGVGDRAVTAQIAVPPVSLGLERVLGEPPIDDV